MKDFHRSGDEIVICHIIEPPQLPTLSLKRECHTMCLAMAHHAVNFCILCKFAECFLTYFLTAQLFWFKSFANSKNIAHHLGLNSLLIVRTLPTLVYLFDLPLLFYFALEFCIVQ